MPAEGGAVEGGLAEVLLGAVLAAEHEVLLQCSCTAPVRGTSPHGKDSPARVMRRIAHSSAAGGMLKGKKRRVFAATIHCYARPRASVVACVTTTRQWNTPTRAAIHMPRPIVAKPPSALAALPLRFGNRLDRRGRWARTLVFARYIRLVDVDITIAELTG